MEEWFANTPGLLKILNVEGLADQLAAKQTLIETVEPADASMENSELRIWFDDSTGAAVVKFKGKDDAGTVMTADLPLA
jgi:hypothetical protein